MEFADLLRQTLDQFHSVSDEDFERFYAIGSPVQFDKRAYLLKAGQVCKGFYFLGKGSVRMFEWAKDKEIHREFFFEQDMASDIRSLRMRESSKFNLVAMEPVEALFFSGARMFELYEESPRFVELGRKILEHKLMALQEFSGMLLSFSPAERYEYMLEHRAHIVQRVPLQYLATYLGMTRETLSRIRGKKN